MKKDRPKNDVQLRFVGHVSLALLYKVRCSFILLPLLTMRELGGLCD